MLDKIRKRLLQILGQLRLKSKKIDLLEEGVGNNLEDISGNSRVLQRQILRLILGGLGILIIIFVLDSIVSGASFSAKKRNKEQDNDEDRDSKVTVEVASKSLDPDKMWRNHYEDKLQDNDDKVAKQLKEIAESFSKEKEEITSNNEKNVRLMEQKLEFATREFDEVTRELKELRNQVAALHANAEEPVIGSSRISSQIINDERNIASPKSIKDFIPATAYVTGTTLGGLVVSTSAHTRDNPIPVIIRIESRGNLPESFATDLSKCRIIGSAYGDLSSVRAMIRAEELVCENDGQIITTKIAGYINGDDGLNGIKGFKDDKRDIQAVRMMLSGLISGFANTAKSADQFNITSLGSISTRKTTMQERLGNNALAGVGDASENMANIFLKEYEALAPVIVVSNARKVDVVFTKGVYLGSSGIKSEIAKERKEVSNNHE
jgi:conjugal transfer pilus assembly protein TraB